MLTDISFYVIIPLLQELGGMIILNISDNLNYIDFHLLEGQVDIILKALELYAYNLHFTFSREEDYELLNSLIYYAYNSILERYSNNSYRIGYDVSKNCRLEIEHKKKKLYYDTKKYYKKVS